MRPAESVAPVGAALTALGTLVCCLPYGFAAATAMASVSAVVATHRAWFLAVSLALLALGIVQTVRARRACRTGGITSVIVLAASALIVITVILFPQLLAGVLANWLP